MATPFEDVRVLRAAEAIADDIWRQVIKWDEFAREVVGKQLTRAVDSTGANIAEAFGRFNYGEKIQFLYYSRGSIFEAKYWLNRSLSRGLMSTAEITDFASRLTEVARQLNSFADSIKGQRHDSARPSKAVREGDIEYATAGSLDAPLFSDNHFASLESVPHEAHNL